MYSLATLFVLAAAGVSTAFAANKTIISFAKGMDGFHSWSEKDDPVMGGKSRGNFTINNGVGVFQGSVVDVPFLKAPGFCSVGTSSFFVEDMSAYASGGLVIRARTTTPDYKGFKMAFGGLGIPAHGGQRHEILGSFKGDFTVPMTTEFTDVVMPFTRFSYDWSDFTGECTTKDPDSGYQHKCCTPSTPDVCPTAKLLSRIEQFSIYMEGAAGQYYLEIESVMAYA
eukprot:m.332362 g.332362  ORF g.332362 m.332362 type:complete len:226 (-) comp16939_c0_seq1:72-749(-)